MRYAFLTIALSISFAPTQAQPDTLFVASGDSVYRFAVRYEALEDREQYTRIGHYDNDPERVAVELGYKHGQPCGIYRAYYPDGKPLIFAVYGFGYLHGDWTEYDEFGRVTIKGRYRDGKRDGTWAFRQQHIVGHYDEGVKDGKWKYYDENGQLVKVEKYRNDVVVPGGTFLFGPSGQ